MVGTWWLVGHISDHNISFRYSSFFLILLESLKLVFHDTCISLTWRLQVEVNLTFLAIDRVVIPIFVGLVIYFIKFTPINFWYLETMWDPTILVSQAIPSKLLLQNIIIVNSSQELYFSEKYFNCIMAPGNCWPKKGNLGKSLLQ